MAELDFAGRTVVITGAGRGIGRAHALLLGSRGANVVVADLGAGVDGDPTGEHPAESVVAEIVAAGGRAVAVEENVATEAGAAAIVGAAVDSFGGLDVLVNNAGIIRPLAFEDLTLADMQKYLDVHYLGSFLLAQRAWPHLRRSGSGRVINTVSPAMLGVADMIAYGGSKAAVFGLTRNLAVAGAESGITVNAISPGAATRMLEASAGAIPIETIEWMRTAVVPEQVAPVVAYLAHPDSQAVTGELFMVAGGSVARQAVVQAIGFVNPALTVEDVAANINRIMDLEGAVLQGAQGM